MDEKKFIVNSTSLSGISSTWSGAIDESRSRQTIELAIPPEFEGPGGAYSPEDLYVLSLLNCYLATFKFVAEKSRLVFSEIKGEGVLFVEKGAEKSLWMSRVELHFTLNGCLQNERALALMEKTKNNCMIINSVKTDVQFTFTANS
jgi:organic hydroperoxide reductase OsmC/OhrA